MLLTVANEVNRKDGNRRKISKNRYFTQSQGAPLAFSIFIHVATVRSFYARLALHIAQLSRVFVVISGRRRAIVVLGLYVACNGNEAETNGRLESE